MKSSYALPHHCAPPSPALLLLPLYHLTGIVPHGSARGHTTTNSDALVVPTSVLPWIQIYIRLSLILFLLSCLCVDINRSRLLCLLSYVIYPPSPLPALLTLSFSSSYSPLSKLFSLLFPSLQTYLIVNRHINAIHHLA